MRDLRKRIYLVKRNEKHVEYEEYRSHVVIAESAPRAREIVSAKAGGKRKGDGDEPPAVWMRKDTAAIYLGFADPRRREGIVHSDYNAG